MHCPLDIPSQKTNSILTTAYSFYGLEPEPSLAQFLANDFHGYHVFHPALQAWMHSEEGTEAEHTIRAVLCPTVNVGHKVASLAALQGYALVGRRARGQGRPRQSQGDGDDDTSTLEIYRCSSLYCPAHGSFLADFCASPRFPDSP